MQIKATTTAIVEFEEKLASQQATIDGRDIVMLLLFRETLFRRQVENVDGMARVEKGNIMVIPPQISDGELSQLKSVRVHMLLRNLSVDDHFRGACPSNGASLGAYVVQHGQFPKRGEWTRPMVDPLQVYPWTPDIRVVEEKKREEFDEASTKRMRETILGIPNVSQNELRQTATSIMDEIRGTLKTFKDILITYRAYLANLHHDQGGKPFPAPRNIYENPVQPSPPQKKNLFI